MRRTLAGGPTGRRLISPLMTKSWQRLRGAGKLRAAGQRVADFSASGDCPHIRALSTFSEGSAGTLPVRHMDTQTILLGSDQI